MHTLSIFTSAFLILLFLGIFIPYVEDAIGENLSGVDTDGLSDIKDTVEYGDILVNILAIPVWTFGLNTWINLVLLLPIRVIMLFSLYYMIFPTKN